MRHRVNHSLHLSGIESFRSDSENVTIRGVGLEPRGQTSERGMSEAYQFAENR